VPVEVVADCIFQITKALEDTAPDALRRDLGEEAFDEVHPRRARGREVQMKTRMLRQPRLHLLCLVGSEGVEHEVQIEALVRRSVNVAQELQELLRPMTRQAFSDDKAASNFERREQRRRAVTLLVVRDGGGATRLKRQARLRAVEGLDLTLFVDAQHQRVLGWVHVKPDDVGDFLLELRIVGYLEGLHEMRLEPGLAPDPLQAGVADANCFRH
jgi:hypothetical protein